MGPDQAKQRIAQELERLGIAERRSEKVRKLSGGLIRRVEIVRALLHRPQLMMLDEPTVGLDHASRQTIIEHVRKLCKEEGLTLLWATHMIDEVAPSDQVLILHNGKLIASDTVQEVIDRTGTENIRKAYEKLIDINN